MSFAVRQVPFMYYWQYQKQEIELQDAGRYMFSHLEKELGLNSHKVIINANGIIKYQTIYGNKQIEPLSQQRRFV